MKKECVLDQNFGMELEDVEVKFSHESAPPKRVRNYYLWAAILALSMLLVAFLVIGLLIAGIIPIPGVGVSSLENLRQTVTEQAEPCTTSDCVRLAGRIVGSMDQTADPCDDFFQYACGGWVEENYISHGKLHSTPVTAMEEEVTSFYKDQLSEYAFGIGKDDPIGFQNYKELFVGCMDGNTRDKRGIEPVKPYVESLGGMNYTGGLGGASFDLTQLINELTIYQTAPFFEVKVQPDGFNNSIHSITPQQIYEALVLFCIQYYGNNTSFSLNHVRDVANVTAEIFELLQPLQQTVTFAEAFANKMSLGELNDLCGSIDWSRLFSHLLGEPKDDTYEIYVYESVYFEALNQLIKNAKADVLNDFAITSLILSIMPLTTSAVKTQPLAWYLEPKFDICFRITNMFLRPASEALFMHKYYKGTSSVKQNVKDMMHYVRQAFLDNIADSDWVDATTRDRILHKASRMGTLISHADVLMNISAVNEMTPKFLSREYFLESLMNATAWYSQITYRTVDSVWTEELYFREIPGISMPNAFYHLAGNIFQIPAGIMDEPFYTVDGPMYINFGSLGTVIGHEITHGYDTKGRQFDEIGQKTTWWKAESIQAFDERKQCFVDQFDNMTVYIPRENIRLKISGNLTLSENIADAGGIRASYRAYEAWRERNGEEAMLVGMPRSVTWKQLFFLAAVQPYCQESTGIYMQYITMKGPHTPSMARVNGWVMNTDDFSSAFQCPKGSPMNPTEKCQIW